MKHLALIMDGNRRWAIQHNLETHWGHKEGASSVDRVANFALNNGIKYLTLYAFSIENLDRTDQEKNFLFDMLANEAESRLDDFKQKGISITFKGDVNLFPDKVKNSFNLIESETKNLNNLYVNILFCYGGQQEIIAAAKKLAIDFKNGLVLEEELEDKFVENLWCSNFPPPELIIRSGGKPRLSNFLTYHSAYSEIIFLDVLWPDITEEHLNECVSNFKSIQRNFGK